MRTLNSNLTRLCSGRLPRRAPFSVWRVLTASLPFLFFLLFFSSSTPAQTLRIAAASDLQFVLPDLAAQYEKQTGVKLAITYGSSGNFVAQIQNGAPFDLFLSADTGYPHKLIAAGQADADSYFVYAIGCLSIWLSPESPLDLAAEGYRTLLDPRIRKIAIANPEHAPYGRAAVIALHEATIYDQVKSKLVFGENASQAAQFVQSGSADAAIIPRSLALSPPMKTGKRYDLTDMRFSLFEQAAVVVKSSPNKAAAKEFLSFLHSEAGRKIFKNYGVIVPPEFPAGLVR
jgi:molybdate transport system substrate-binding protein